MNEETSNVGGMDAEYEKLASCRPPSEPTIEEKCHKEEVNICASAFMALLEANGIPKPGDPDFEAHKEEINFFSFIFSKGFEIGLMVGKQCDQSCGCKEKSSIILP